MNARVMALAGLAAILLAAGGANAQTHAPWPMDWNNWSDPALWCTVGDPGNAEDTRFGRSDTGAASDPVGYGSVGYTYRIGKFEVTAGQYTAFLNAVGGIDLYWLYNTGMWSSPDGCKIARSGGGTAGDPYTYTVAGDFANRPVNHVSYWDSCRFANWLSNGQPRGLLTGNAAHDGGLTEDGAYTLNGYNGYDGRTIQRTANAKYAVTSEDEWYKAAYYKGGSTNAGYWHFPTRTDSVPGRDMTEATNPGNNANYYEAPYPIDSGKYTTVAGEFQNSPGPYGTFDQGGNVYEWNEAIPCYQYSTYASRGLRGGSYDYYDYNLSAASRNSQNTAYEYYFIGFRIVEVPEPATIGILALGSIRMLMRRRGLRR
jgi:formylglycine-generating enzyme